MHTKISVTLAITAGLALLGAQASAKELKVLSDTTVSGFGHVESVAYDPRDKAFYASDFGPDLKPADKDGKGFISKLSMDGKVVEKRFFPAEGQTLNKPKGIWIRGNRMWFTDIDSVWVVDLKTKQGKKLELPGIQFANDPTVIGKRLYVSDNRSDQLFSVEPADFLKAKEAPKVEVVLKGKGIFPNGLYPGQGGSLLMAGLEGADKMQAIYELTLGSEPKALTDKFGRLDGLYRMKGGDLIATDWATGSVFQWSKKMGAKKLAGDFKGPADFAAVPNDKGLLLAVPDLVKGDIRLIQLGK